MNNYILKFFLLLSLLISTSVFSNDDFLKSIKPMTPEQRAAFEKLPEKEKQQAMIFMMMMIELEIEANKRVYQKVVVPQKLITGKEGLKFKSKIPFLGEADPEKVLSSYNKNAAIKDEDYQSENIVNHCIGCFRGRKYPEGKLSLKFYPVGTEFTIDEFIGVPGKIFTFISDSTGKRISVNKFDLQDMIDGGSGGFQNEELILLDILVSYNNVLALPVKINTLEFDNFRTGINTGRKNWDFPPFRLNDFPMLEAYDFQGWLSFAAAGFLNSPPTLFKLANQRKIEHDVVVDVSTDVNTFVMLLYTKLISPYFKIENHGAFDDNYRIRWKNDKGYLLGEKVDLFLNKLEKNIKVPPMPTGEEKKKLMKEVMKDMEKEFSEKGSKQ